MILSSIAIKKIRNLLCSIQLILLLLISGILMRLRLRGSISSRKNLKSTANASALIIILCESNCLRNPPPTKDGWSSATRPTRWGDWGALVRLTTCNTVEKIGQSRNVISSMNRSSGTMTVPENAAFASFAWMAVSVYRELI